MSERVTVGAAADFPPGTSRVVTAGGRRVAVFNVAGTFFALDDECAHRRQPLHDGVIRDGVLTCPAHLWRYDVATGVRVDADGWQVAAHTVVVETGSVVVEVAAARPEVPISELLRRHAREWSRE